jgi:hypothetical protein
LGQVELIHARLSLILLFWPSENLSSEARKNTDLYSFHKVFFNNEELFKLSIESGNGDGQHNGAFGASSKADEGEKRGYI